MVLITLVPIAQIVHRRIVAGFITHKQIRINKLRLLTVQDGFQHFWGNFTAATSAVAVLGQNESSSRSWTSPVNAIRVW